MPGVFDHFSASVHIDALVTPNPVDQVAQKTLRVVALDNIVYVVFPYCDGSFVGS